MFYSDYEINYFDEQILKVNKFIKNTPTQQIYENEIKVGDKIIIYFYPNSQKYMYILYPKYGKVIEDRNNSDEEYSLLNVIIKNDNEIYNAFHCGVSLYSTGFDYEIIKLI